MECQGCSVCAADTAGADDQSGASPDHVLRSLVLVRRALAHAEWQGLVVLGKTSAVSQTFPGFGPGPDRSPRTRMSLLGSMRRRWERGTTVSWALWHYRWNGMHFSTNLSWRCCQRVQNPARWRASRGRPRDGSMLLCASCFLSAAPPCTSSSVDFRTYDILPPVHHGSRVLRGLWPFAQSGMRTWPTILAHDACLTGFGGCLVQPLIPRPRRSAMGRTLALSGRGF